MIGRVVSIKNQQAASSGGKNTASVLVERVAVSPLYGKMFIRSKKYLVDDSIRVKMGDLVEIINCKPLSKRKNWKVVKVLGRSLAEITEEKLKLEAQEAISEVMPEKQEEASKPLDQNISEPEKKVSNILTHGSTDKPKKTKKETK